MKPFFNLTPLLDVILILLFAFIMQKNIDHKRFQNDILSPRVKEIRDNKLRIVSLRLENSFLKEKLAKFKNEIQSVREKNASLAGINSSLLGEKNRVELKMKNLHKSLSTKEYSVKQLKEQRKSLQKKNLLLQASYSKQMQRSSLLKNEIQEKEKSITELKQNNVNLQDEISQLELSLNGEKERATKLYIELQIRKEDLKILKQSNTRIAMEREHLNDTYRALAKMIAETFFEKAEEVKKFEKELSATKKLGNQNRENFSKILQQLKTFSNFQKVLQEVLKYKALKEQFHPIRLRISKDDILYFNEEKQNIRLETAESVRKLLLDKIKKDKENKSGIGSRIFLSWSRHSQSSYDFVEMVRDGLYNLNLEPGISHLVLVDFGSLPTEQVNEK
ncbi:hypothetical protein ACFL35_12775 [Candidatus Riflebacteria bacterium]